MMSDLLEAPIWMPVLVLTLTCVLIVLPPTVWSLRRARTDRGNDNTTTAGLRLSGSALVLISGFLAVQNFQLELQHDGLVTKELQQAEAMLRVAESARSPQQSDLWDMLVSYANEVRAREFTHLTGLPHLKGAIGDPLVDDLVRRMNPAAMAADAGVSPSREWISAYRSFRDAREQRLSYRELLPPVLIWVLALCGASTLVMAGAYPSGPSDTLKWLQSMSAAVVVATLLSMQVVIVSPQMSADRRDSQVQLLIQAVQEARAQAQTRSVRPTP